MAVDSQPRQCAEQIMHARAVQRSKRANDTTTTTTTAPTATAPAPPAAAAAAAQGCTHVAVLLGAREPVVHFEQLLAQLAAHGQGCAQRMVRRHNNVRPEATAHCGATPSLLALGVRRQTAVRHRVRAVPKLKRDARVAPAPVQHVVHVASVGLHGCLVVPIDQVVAIVVPLREVVPQTVVTQCFHCAFRTSNTTTATTAT